MEVAVNDCRALDVQDKETGERFGFLIDTGQKPNRWIVVAILPSDARGQIIGAVKRPKAGIVMLMENERELVRGR